MAEELKIESTAPIGEPVFQPAPLTSTPAPIVQTNPPIDPVIPPKSTTSTGMADLNYTKIAFGILGVSVICLAIYWFKVKGAKVSATMAALQANLDQKNAELEALKNSNTKPQTSQSTNSFF